MKIVIFYCFLVADLESVSKHYNKTPFN